MRTPALIALLVSLGAAAPAQAATTVGNNLSPTPTSSVSLCEGADVTCTVVPKTLTSNRAAGGLDAVTGVVVRWRVRTEGPAPGVSIALRVVQGRTGLGRSAFESMTSQAPGIVTFAARLPVTAGDRLGVDMIVPAGATSAPIARGTTSNAELDRWQPSLGIGETRPPNNDKRYELLLNADIEPDADADGWGDETQDGCRGTAGTADGCPPPLGAPPPAEPGTPPAGTTVTTPLGTSATPPGTSATPPGTSDARPQAPVAAALAVDDGRPPQITALQFNATRVRFRISERATVSLAVQRVRPGRSVLGRCVKPTRANSRARRCLRLVSVLSGTTNVLPGLNTARIRRLPAGRYRVRLLSIDRAGRRGRAVVRYFRLPA
jgi:hypothetical protein